MSTNDRPTWPISAHTGKDYRDDGSFWRPLREAFRFELPTEVLKLIHKHYVIAEFEHARDLTSNPLSARTDNQLQLDFQRLSHASTESGACMCYCGKVGGCLYSCYTKDGEYDGYDQRCDIGDVPQMTTIGIDEEIHFWFEPECEKRGIDDALLW